VAADSAALRKLEEGHPVAALKHAFRARSLVDSVRNQVIEESIR
jgi:hypothetical protein